jgi:hypothetical protein
MAYVEADRIEVIALAAMGQEVRRNFCRHAREIGRGH